MSKENKIKVLIEISEEEYLNVQRRHLPIRVFNACVYAVENGIPVTSDLISREALLKAVTEQVTHITVDGHLAKDKAIRLIKNAPEYGKENENEQRKES